MSDACQVTVEINPKGVELTFTSPKMRALMKEKAAEVVKEKEELAEEYLHGPKPKTGLYGYRVKKGDHTYYAVIFPTSAPGYYIGRKYGTL